MDKDHQKEAIGATGQRQLLWENGELLKVLVSGVVSPSVGEALKVFTESPTIQMIRRFKAHPAIQIGAVMRSIPLIGAALGGVAAFDTTRKLVRDLEAATGTSLGSMSIRELLELSSQLSESRLATFISSGGLDRVNEAIENVAVDDVSIAAWSDGHVVTPDDLEIDTEIVEQLEKGNQQALTVDQKLRLQYFILLIVLVWKGLAEWSSVQQGVCDLNARLSYDAPFAEVRRQVRTEFCGKPAASVRIVKAENVNLRAGAGMSFEVIAQLDKGLVVAVVSREDRDWLEVSFERDGYVIEGWVSRKFLARVR